MAKKLIFISCGQSNDAERQLGFAVKKLIDQQHGFEAYFAENVQDLDSLANNVFRAVQQCSGAVVFLQDRGRITAQDGSVSHRSSVWVNQEIALLAYRQFSERNKIPILAFREKTVRVEGAMTALIVNPTPFESQEKALQDVLTWLMNSEFPAPTLAAHDMFERKWQSLSDQAKRVLACIAEEGGERVKVSLIKRCLRKKYGVPDNEASLAVLEIGSQLNSEGLIHFVHDIFSGDEMTLNPTWRWHILGAIDRSGKSENS